MNYEKVVVENEHINSPNEIFCELEKRFKIIKTEYYPLKIPIVSVNLVIGLILAPKK